MRHTVLPENGTAMKRRRKISPQFQDVSTFIFFTCNPVLVNTIRINYVFRSTFQGARGAPGKSGLPGLPGLTVTISLFFLFLPCVAATTFRVKN